MLEMENEYERRYATTEYMKDWGRSRHRRVVEIIQSIGLPSRGRALDYGCGVGFFCSALQEALPGWEIIGVETSDAALEGARKTYTQFKFVTFNDIEDQTFDFVFSHHVLEHVESIEDTAKNINRLLNSDSWQLHICPCGNKGSLEYKIASKKVHGMDPLQGNRFFYEDPTHLRRLTTKNIEDVFGLYGFRIILESYRNYFWGGVSWISNSPLPVIVNISRHMPVLCMWLIILHVLQRPYRLWWGVRNKKKKKPIHIAFLVCAAFPAFVLSPIAFILDAFVRKETNDLDKAAIKTQSGSEMCIVLQRG